MFGQHSALSSYVRMSNDLLSGVGDGPFPHAAISAALGREETQFEVVPGSELRQAGSLTALLRDARDPACTVFLKKVTAGLVANKAWNDRRRVLLYIRNELRFYEEFADGLRQRGVDIPPAYFLSSSNLDGLEGYEEEPPPDLLGTCGALMFLEPLADPRFHQASPLSPSQASTILEAAARLHAAAWQDAPTLERAAARLQRHGGSFALSARNPKELANLADSWGSPRPSRQPHRRASSPAQRSPLWARGCRPPRHGSRRSSAPHRATHSRRSCTATSRR